MKIKIASRSSKLALKQVEEFNKTFLIKEYDLIKTSTRGDELSAKGETLFDKGNFVSDIEKLISRYGIIGAGAGSLFVFKGRFRAVLINYPSFEEKEQIYKNLLC